MFITNDQHSSRFYFYGMLISGIFWLACAGHRADTKEIVQYYGTGEISRKHTEIDGKKEGIMVEYYVDGKIKGELQFNQDLQDGRTVYYYPGGQIKEVQYYKAGVQYGGDTVFYENGQLKFLRNFTDGILDGYLRKWAEDGTLIFEARYDMNRLVEVKGEAVTTDSTLSQ